MLVDIFITLIYGLSLSVLLFFKCSCFLYFLLLQDKSSTSNLKIEALVFTKLVLASHAPPVFHPYIKVGKH